MKSRKTRSKRARQKAKAELREAPRTELVEGGFGQGFDRVLRVVDTLTLMRRAKQLDDRQMEAASIYRRAYEVVAGARLQSPLGADGTGGGSPGSTSPTSEHLWASEKLAEAAKLLGIIDGAVVAMVCGQGMSIEKATLRLCGTGKGGRPRRTDREVYGSRLRAALTILADKWLPRSKGKRSHGVHYGEDWRPKGGVAGTVERASVAHAEMGKVRYGGRR